MSRDSEPPVRRSIHAAAWRAAGLVLLLGLALAVVRWTPVGEFLTEERVASVLGELRHTAWAAPVLIALYALLSPLGLPVSPLLFAGGAVFGFALGSLINLAGCLLGAILSFLLARQLGRDLVLHVVSRKRLEQVEHLLERHGFWALVRVRFVPGLPFALVNFGAALAGIRFSVFLSSSVVSLLPSLAVWTYLSHALVSAAAEERAGMVLAAVAALLALFALSFVPSLLRTVASGGDEA